MNLSERTEQIMRLIGKSLAILLTIMMCISSIAPALAVYAQDESAENTEVSASFDDEGNTEDIAESDDNPSDEENASDAGDATPEAYVASIADEKFISLQDAVDAAKDGDTIILLADIELESSVRVEGKSIIVSDDGSPRTLFGRNNAISPLFDIASESELTLDGTETENLKLIAAGTCGYMNGSAITTAGVLNIMRVTIDGGNLGGGQSIAVVMALTGAQVNMSDGIIENTVIDSNTSPSATVFVNGGAHLEMSGGTIRNNINRNTATNCGGGVLLWSWQSSDPFATMNLSGGVISGNTAQYGGGIYMTGRSTLHMTGGSVDGNTARRDGGGICVSGVSGTGWYKENEFIMDGGSISGNKAANGAGIYVNSDAVYLNAGYIEHNVTGKITNNDFTGHGGGVYVSNVPRVLHISDAVITENTARPLAWIGGTSGMGGGLWACPTGSIDLKVSNGVAIYGNSTSGKDSAGDDVVNVHYAYQSPHGTITLPDRMLGGGRVEWYHDGKIQDHVVGYVASGSTRFDPENPGEPIHFNAMSESVAAKAVTTDAAIKRANEEAKLFIRYNTANHGGGIATNGDLELKSYDYKDWKLVVEKKWEGIEEDNQKEIKLFLRINGEILDSVTLNAENEWKGEFNDLPDQETVAGRDISVVEGDMLSDEDGETRFVEEDEYVVDYEKLISEEELTIYMTAINSPRPPVRITKKALGGDELEGAEIEIRDAAGELVDKWTSAKEAHEIVLRKGDYILKELIAPEGYYAVATDIAFSVNERGEVHTESVEITDDNGGRVVFDGNNITIEDSPTVREIFEDEKEEEKKEKPEEKEEEKVEEPEKTSEEAEEVKGVSRDEVKSVSTDESKGVKTGDGSMLLLWTVILSVAACAMGAAIIKRRRADNN